MSLADDFLRDADATQQAPTPLSAQFAQDVSGPPPAPPMADRPQPQPLSDWDRFLANVPTSLVNNPAVAATRNIVTSAAGPVMGGAQLLANLFPDSTGVPQAYNRKIAEVLRKDQAAAKENPLPGTSSFVGSVISPANLAMASTAAPAVTAGTRAIQGAKVGAAGGATAPVDTGDSGEGKFWGPKALETVLGTVGGAVLAPVVGAVVDRVARLAGKVTPVNAGKEADNIIDGALQESGQKASDLPPDQLQALRQKTVEALSKGQRLDAAAMLRMQDFDREKIKPTLGMITRDPAQWAAEQNVRGVTGAGEPVQRLIAEGNQGVTQGVGQYSNNAAEAPVASQQLAKALRDYDAGKRQTVTAAYNAARDAVGKDLEIPIQGLAQDYADIMGRYSDNVRKSLPLDTFKQYGLDGGKQTKAFTFEEADKVLKTLNANKSSEPAVNSAIGELRDAVKRAVTDVDASGGPFAPAVSLARQRFAEQEAIPAITEATQGNADDRFVQQQIINNPSTERVQRLATLLKTQSPDTFEQARQQIGAHLARSAFGENVAGDKIVSQEAYNRALRQLGTGKLEAFFEPEEIDQMKRLGRLASYQVSPPAGAASNYSNTASALANVLRQVGGVLPVGRGAVQFLGDKAESYGATNPKVPVTPNLTDQQRLALARALTALTGGASLTAAPRIIGQ